LRKVTFIGRSLKNIRNFPVAAKRQAGYQLDRLQRGLNPTDWKPIPSIGKGVKEIRILERDQYRVIYLVASDQGVIVLHAFSKKSRKTRKSDISIARQALRDLLGR